MPISEHVLDYSIFDFLFLCKFSWGNDSDKFISNLIWVSLSPGKEYGKGDSRYVRYVHNFTGLSQLQKIYVPLIIYGKIIGFHFS